MALKDRLQELRGNISQRKCAENLGVKFANYNKWEQGAAPNIETLIKIADYYGVTLDYLTGRVDYNDIQYKSSSKQTGLSENALKGLAKIKESSEHGNVDLFRTLNWLLARELEPQIESRLSELQNDSQKHLFELFSVNINTPTHNSSLSQILYYIAHPDNLLYGNLHNLTTSLQEIVCKSKELTDMEKSDLLKCVNLLENSTEHILDTSSDTITAKILVSLRHEYSLSPAFSKNLAGMLRRTYSILDKAIDEESKDNPKI